jgi:DNA replication protein DnaC
MSGSTSTMAETEILRLCKRLHLPSVAMHATRIATEGVRAGTGHLDFLAELLRIEVEDRAERRAQRRMKEAAFPIVKTLQGFDFRRAPHLPEASLRQLAEGGYIDRAEPVILIGEPGTGKTHLATALGAAAAQQGRRVRFVTTARLVNELVEARDSRELNRVVSRYARVDLLILDELAYVPLGTTDAELLFSVLGERHERRAIVITTNLPFSEWTTVVPNARLCRAMLDRLTDRAHIIDTGTESARLRDSLSRRKKPKK